MDGELIGIYKGKRVETDPANFRSIFFFDATEKYFASMVCERLNLRAGKRALNTQHGLCAGMFTEQVILALRVVIQEAIDRHCVTILLFFDFKKALDPLPYL